MTNTNTKLVEIQHISYGKEDNFLIDTELETMEFIAFCMKYINENQPIIVEYNEGFEEKIGIYEDASEDSNFKRIFFVEKASLSQELPLRARSIINGNQISPLVTSKEAIASYRVATEDDELYKELEKVQYLYDMDLDEFLKEFRDDKSYELTEDFTKYSNLINKLNLVRP